MHSIFKSPIFRQALFSSLTSRTLHGKGRPGPYLNLKVCSPTPALPLQALTEPASLLASCKAFSVSHFPSGNRS
jgi:hypothetical protein